MTKTIFIREKKDCFQICREVITRDELPVHYGPVFRIDKIDFKLESFSNALFTSFNTAGIKLKTISLGESKEAYQEYKKYILQEYNESSFQQLAKKSTLYILEFEGQQIKFMPTIYSSRGNTGDEENYKIISTHRKLKIQIAQEILDLMCEYKIITSKGE